MHLSRYGDYSIFLAIDISYLLFLVLPFSPLLYRLDKARLCHRSTVSLVRPTNPITAFYLSCTSTTAHPFSTQQLFSLLTICTSTVSLITLWLLCNGNVSTWSLPLADVTFHWIAFGPTIFWGAHVNNLSLRPYRQPRIWFLKYHTVSRTLRNNHHPMWYIQELDSVVERRRNKPTNSHI